MKKRIFIFSLMIFVTISFFGAEICATINPDEQWQERKPQLAVWIEDSSENYVSTIYITKGASKKAWFFSPKEGRPDSLPVWYATTKINPADTKKIDKEFRKKLDAVTSATPKKQIVAKANVDLENGKTYIIKAEVNQSFDYNEKWTKDNSGVNGQPSVIYMAKFTYSQNTPTITLEFYATGSIDGSDGNIYFTEKENLSTAIKIIKDISVVIK